MLESKIDALTVAINTLNDTMQKIGLPTKPPKPHADPGGESQDIGLPTKPPETAIDLNPISGEPVNVQPEKPAEPQFTIDQVKKALTVVVEKHALKFQAATGILARFGVATVPALKPEQYADVIKKCAAVLKGEAI